MNIDIQVLGLDNALLLSGFATASTAIGVFAYYGIVAAMRVGEVSFVTPFRYSRLIFAMIIGVSFFGERPDLFTILGGAVIVASGIYTVLRERKHRLKPLAVPLKP